MAKNKQKSKKNMSVFEVANKQSKKKKNTAKPVKSSLKHIKAVKNQKVENLNQIFTAVQTHIITASKSGARQPKKLAQVVRAPPKESVNVDSAAQLFSQL